MIFLATADRMRALPRNALPVDAVPRAIWPAVLLFYSILVPEEVRLQFGDFRFYVFRLSLFALLPFTLSMIVRGRIRLGLRDLLVLVSGFWFMVSMIYHEGFGKGLESGGVSALDVTSSYLVGRCYLRSPAQLRRFLRAILPGVVLIGVILLVESFSHVLLIRPVAASIFGTALGGRGDAVIEIRHGFARAYGPFPHPILAGLLVASFLPLYWSSLKGAKGRLGSAASLAAFFTLSSAGIMSLTLNIVLLMIDRLVKTFRDLTWSSVLWAALALSLIVNLLSKSGVFSVIIRYLTLDAGTGFYRLLIWEYGSAEIMRHPMFGIGFNNWIRPAWMYSDSVDAHWLAIGMQYGLPAALALLLVTVASVTLLASRRVAFGPADSKVAAAVAISLASMFLMMFTVTLWNNVYSWFCLLLGCATGISRTAAGRNKARWPQQESTARAFSDHAGSYPQALK